MIEEYSEVKVVCFSSCKEAPPKATKVYFQLYYDDSSYEYNVKRVDYITEDVNWHLDRVGHSIYFIDAPGHSSGSVCIAIEDMFFGGDIIMPLKPVIEKRAGGSLEVYRESLRRLIDRISQI